MQKIQRKDKLKNTKQNLKQNKKKLTHRYSSFTNTNSLNTLQNVCCQTLSMSAVYSFSLSLSLFIEYLSRVLLKTRDFALCGYMYGVAVFVYCLHVCAHMNNSEIVSNLFVCFSLFCKLFFLLLYLFFCKAERQNKANNINNNRNN